MSLWEAPQPDVVRKFTTMAESSPHGVEGIGSGALSPPPRPEDAGERVTELARYFFKEVVAKAITYMQHDYMSSYRPKHLAWALEQFAKDVRQQQTLPQYIQDADDDEVEDDNNAEEEGGSDKNAEDIDMEEEEEEDDADEEVMEEIIAEEEAQSSDDEDFVYALDCDDLSTPTFDELFPPANASIECVSKSVLAQTWNETGVKYHKSDHDVVKESEETFYTKLNGALNAYIATMLLEPRKLDAAFAKVDT